jgi:GT2 family glycosyltransferase
MSKREKLYILLPVHNRRQITKHFLHCLLNQTYQNYHLILIDDGSTDGTEDMVRCMIPTVTVIKGNGKWWWAGSLQQGYYWVKSHKIRRTDIILIINDDTEIENDFLEKAVSILSNLSNTVLGAYIYSKQTEKLIGRGLFVDWKKMSFQKVSDTEEINCLSTRGVFLRAGDFIKIGGFFPKLLPHYLSDYEYTIRANRKGIRLTTSPLLKLILDETLTGHKNLLLNSIESIKKYFSVKSPNNPIYVTIFILLACPWKWKLLNIVRVWYSFACKIRSANTTQI